MSVSLQEPGHRRMEKQHREDVEAYFIVRSGLLGIEPIAYSRQAATPVGGIVAGDLLAYRVDGIIQVARLLGCACRAEECVLVLEVHGPVHGMAGDWFGCNVTPGTGQRMVMPASGLLAHVFTYFSSQPNSNRVFLRRPVTLS